MKILLATALLATLSGSAFATTAPTCLTRAYSADHLKENPSQVIEAAQMKIDWDDLGEASYFLKAAGVEIVGTDGTAPWEGTSIGSCSENRSGTLSCESALGSDFGGFEIDFRALQGRPGVALINNSGFKLLTCDNESNACTIEVEGKANKEYHLFSVPCI